MSYRDPLPVGLEIWVEPPGEAGRWLDITEDLSDDGVEISPRGRANEAGQSDATQMQCRLRSLDGKYSPRNPRSPLFGLIGRNTPIRFWVEEGAPRVVQWETTGLTPDRFEAPPAAGIVTGDLDVRLDMRLRDGWRPGESGTLLTLPKSWRVGLTGDGRPTLAWYTNETTEQILTCTEPVPGGMTGRKVLRVTLDVDNGSGKTVATFWTAATMAGPWSQIGAPAIATGVTALRTTIEFLSTACTWPCEVYAVQVRSGIAGTVISDVDFTADYVTQTWDPTGHWRVSLTDAASVIWDQAGGARLWSRRFRFHGEVTTWPQRWTLKGSSTVTAPIEASGILRRLGQGASPVLSAIRRGCESLGPALVAYWPCEDEQRATSIAPAGPYPTGITVGTAYPAAYSGFAGSDPILELGRAGALFDVPLESPTGQVQVRWLNHFPSADLPHGTVLLRVRLTAGIGWVDMLYQPNGALQAKAFDRAGTELHATNSIAFLANDRDLRVSLELKQSGADVTMRMVTVEAGFSSGLVWEATVPATTVGAVARVEVNPDAEDFGGWGFGHLTVERAITTVFDLSPQFAAFNGERADSRIKRLGYENGIDLRWVGRGAGAERLGPQPRGTMLDLMADAVTSEGGILAEQRDGYGLWFRTLESLVSQDPPTVTIPYTDNLLVPFEPEDDDQGTRNLVTVQRRDGSAATVEDSTSRMGTAQPPAGAGLYDEDVTLSLARDASAVQQAGWLVHLGTVDEARWPRIGVDLAHPVFAGDAVATGDPDLVAAVLDLDQGDRLDVTNLPAWLPPYDVQQIVQGYSETITPPDPDEREQGNRPGFHHRIVFNCTPASPYQAGRWVASSYQTETTTTTTTTTVETPVPPVILIEDDFTGTNGTAWSSKWALGNDAGGGTATLQSGWGRITVGSGVTIMSRRLAGGSFGIVGRTATVVESASTTSITGTLPTDRQAGDLCIAAFAINGTPAQFTGPGGSWVQVVAPTDSGVGQTIAVYRQFSPASAPVASTSGTASRATAICQSYGGVDPATPIDVAAAIATATGVTNLNAPSVTTVTAGALLLSGAMADTSPGSRLWVTPSGMTMVAQANNATTSGRSLGLAQELRPAAGATGTRNWTHTPVSAGVAMAAYQVALRPAGGAQPVAHRATTQTTFSSAASSFAFSTPSGAVSGDLLVASFAYETLTTTDISNTLPAGWTEAPPAADGIVDIGGTQGIHVVVATKTATGGAENHTWTTASNASDAVISVSAYSGADVTTPWDVTGYATQPSSANTHLTASIIPTITGGMLYGALANRINISTGAITDTPSGTARTTNAKANPGTPGQQSGTTLTTADTSGSAVPSGTARRWTVTLTDESTTTYSSFLGLIRPATGGGGGSSATFPNAGNITFKYRVAGFVFPEFLIRHSTTALDRKDDYGLRMPTPQESRLRLFKHTNYSYGSPLGEADLAVASGQVIRVRIRVDGSRLRVKAWPDASTEPTAWMIDVTDTTYTATGYWGFYAGAANTGSSYLEVDDFRWDDGASGTTTTTETTTTTTTTTTAVPAGASPWRWDNPNSRLVSAVDGAETGLQVEVTGGPRWTTDANDLPFGVLLGGELVTVTSVADITNLAPNPTLAVDTTGWTFDDGSGNATATRELSGGKHGPTYYRITFEE